MSTVPVIFLFLSGNLVYSQYVPACLTIDQNPGNCILLQQCSIYMKMLHEIDKKESTFNVLRKVHCGFEGSNPKVCCPRTNAGPVIGSTQYAGSARPQTFHKSVGDYVRALPEPPVCGQLHIVLDRVYKQNTKLGTFPWFAILGYQGSGSNVQWRYGGSLITAKHILTAAHVIHGQEQTLRLARFYTLKSDQEDGFSDYAVKSIIKHEQYNPADYSNNIGILVLENTVRFTDAIKPICIPKTSELRANTFESYHPVVAKWERLNNYRVPPTSQYVNDVIVLSNDVCKKNYADSPPRVDERELCAGYTRGDFNVCDEDIGVPLIQPIYDHVNFTTSYYQTGVLSFAKSCANPDFPGVYARVTHYVAWIEEKVTGGNSY